MWLWASKIESYDVEGCFPEGINSIIFLSSTRIPPSEFSARMQSGFLSHIFKFKFSLSVNYKLINNVD